MHQPEPHSEDEKIKLSEPVVSEVSVEEKPEPSAQARRRLIRPRLLRKTETHRWALALSVGQVGLMHTTTLARLPEPNHGSALRSLAVKPRAAAALPDEEVRPF